MLLGRRGPCHNQDYAGYRRLSGGATGRSRSAALTWAQICWLSIQITMALEAASRI